jgi:hypothetical protein
LKSLELSQRDVEECLVAAEPGILSYQVPSTFCPSISYFHPPDLSGVLHCEDTRNLGQEEASPSSKKRDSCVDSLFLPGRTLKSLPVFTACFNCEETWMM